MPTSLPEIMLVISLAGWMLTSAADGIGRAKAHTTEKARSAVQQLRQEFQRMGEW